MTEAAYLGYNGHHNGETNGLPPPPSSMLSFSGHENFPHYGSLYKDYPANGLTGLGSSSFSSYATYSAFNSPLYAPPGRLDNQNSLLTPPGSPEEHKPAGTINGLHSKAALFSGEQLASTSRVSLTSEHNPVLNASAAIRGTSASPNALTCAMATATTPLSKRQRAEKKPIPEDLKDDKYFERRKRNNLAAKRSRDNRKTREDEIAIRASYLEKENAILRAQVNTLREEANSLRHLLIQKRSATSRP